MRNLLLGSLVLILADLASVLPAQNAVGYDWSVSIPVFGQRRVTFVGDARFVFDGQRVGGEGGFALTLSAPAEAAFLEGLTAGVVVFGERTRGEIWVVAATPALTPRLVTTIPNLRDGTVLDGTRIFVSVGTAAGTEVLQVNLLDGSAQTAVRLSGPPGPVTMDDEGLWIATVDPARPTEPGTSTILHFSESDLGFAVFRNQPLAASDADRTAPAQDPAVEIAADNDRDVFVLGLDGSIREVSFEDGLTSNYIGTQQFTPVVTHLRYLDVQYRDREGTVAFEPFQPEGSGELIAITEGGPRRGSTGLARFVTPRRPELTAPGHVAPGLAFRIRFENGPLSGPGLLAIGPGLGLEPERLISVPGFEQLVPFQPRLLTATVIPVIFDEWGRASVDLVNPGLGSLGIITQCVFADLVGGSIGSSTPAAIQLY